MDFFFLQWSVFDSLKVQDLFSKYEIINTSSTMLCEEVVPSHMVGFCRKSPQSHSFLHCSFWSNFNSIYMQCFTEISAVTF